MFAEIKLGKVYRKEDLLEVLTPETREMLLDEMDVSVADFDFGDIVDGDEV